MLGSLSLARQGRYFYWGYSADPDEMTAGAKATLVNVLHYMQGKRGEETVPFACKTRKILWVYTVLGRDKGYLRGVEEHFPNQLTPKWRETYTPTFAGPRSGSRSISPSCSVVARSTRAAATRRSSRSTSTRWPRDAQQRAGGLARWVEPRRRARRRPAARRGASRGSAPGRWAQRRRVVARVARAPRAAPRVRRLRGLLLDARSGRRREVTVAARARAARGRGGCGTAPSPPRSPGRGSPSPASSRARP